jgi:hypothetical protein
MRRTERKEQGRTVLQVRYIQGITSCLIIPTSSQLEIEAHVKTDVSIENAGMILIKHALVMPTLPCLSQEPTRVSSVGFLIQYLCLCPWEGVSRRK